MYFVMGGTMCSDWSAGPMCCDWLIALSVFQKCHATFHNIPWAGTI